MNRTTNRPPIDWTFWSLSRLVEDWQAAALSLGINPDAMTFSPDAWMANTSKQLFEVQSFRNADEKAEFDKRYRLVEAWARDHDDRVRYHNTSKIELTGFAAWCVENGLPVPAEFASWGRTETEGVDAGTAPAASATADDDPDSRLAALFDPVGVHQLEAMFNGGHWSQYAERAKSNGLITARVGRGQFNPYLAARWWLHHVRPERWTWEACLRKLARNLPARSTDSAYLLTGNLPE